MGEGEFGAQTAEEIHCFVSTAEERIHTRGDEGDGEAGKEGKARKEAKRKAKKEGRRKVRKDEFIIRASTIQDPSPSGVLLRYALSDQLLRITNAYLELRS